MSSTGEVSIKIDEVLARRLDEIAKQEQLSLGETIRRLVDVCGAVVSTNVNATSYATEVIAAKSPVSESGPLVVWDLPSGAISYRSAKRRYFMVNARAWALLEEALFVNLMKGAAQMVFEMGRAYGNAVAHEMTGALEDLPKAKLYIEQMAALTGLGRVSMEGDVAGAKKLKVRVDNCVFCAGKGSASRGRDSCYFLMGIGKGLIDTIYDCPHTVHESRCSLRGDDYCELVVNSKEGSEEKDTNWGFRVLFPHSASRAPGA